MEFGTCDIFLRNFTKIHRNRLTKSCEDTESVAVCVRKSWKLWTVRGLKFVHSNHLPSPTYSVLLDHQRTCCGVRACARVYFGGKMSAGVNKLIADAAASHGRLGTTVA